MKKKLLGLLLGVSLVGSLVGCAGNSDNAATTGGSGDGNASGKDKVIKVGASVTPHAEILEAVKDDLAKEGYTLEIIEYNDYVLPNTALESGDLDANYFQHKPYLDDFNEKNGTHIVLAAGIHYEPFGIFAGKESDLSKLKDGAVIAVPNDATNEARALLLLEDNGLIKLKDGVGVAATVLDIEENPHNIEIKELEAAQVARAAQDVDIIAVNGNYALEAGIKIEDALALESADSVAAQTYANIIAVKSGNENSEKTKALVNALKTEKVKKFIEEHYNGAVVAIFE